MASQYSTFSRDMLTVGALVSLHIPQAVFIKLDKSTRFTVFLLLSLDQECFKGLLVLQAKGIWGWGGPTSNQTDPQGRGGPLSAMACLAYPVGTPLLWTMVHNNKLFK